MNPPEDSGASVDLLEALSRSGDVGQHLAAVDWSATPLGEPSRWDHSLATMVRAIIASRFSMWMAWGPDLTFFCNDAYRRDTLATKYPWALGRPAHEVWEEIWDDISPRIASVMETGEATWDQSLLLFLERSGYVEETYHTFSYSPLTDDRGHIAGMLCVVTEETERVIGERRMETLNALGAIDGVGLDDRGYLQEAATALSANLRSLPFTLMYLLDDGGVAQLCGASGAQAGDPVAPASIDPRDPSADWPLAQARGGETVLVEDLARRFASVPPGAWAEPPRSAMVVPMLSPVAGAGPLGFLIVGANQFRPVDAAYRTFLELIAAQVASGVSGARAYEAERQRAEDLAALDTAKTTFFTNVSHELRTPLTLLLSPAEDMLVSGTERSDAERQRLELIVRNGQRLLKLVNTLLDFSRLESGRNEALFEPVDLSESTVELISMFESALDHAGLTLVVDCPPLPQPVWVDREMWAKIVLNLLSNALKFTPQGTITVALAPLSDGRVRLEVTDTGIGISEADQARLFERFQRVAGAGARTYEGTGIGLALVAELASVHGGEASVTSRLGEGSRFSVTLPYGPEQLPAAQLAPEGAPETSVQRAARAFLAEVETWLPDGAAALPGVGRGTDAPAPAPGSAPRLLVVDDNADMRRYVTSLLAETYVIDTASDGVEGLAMALADPPDLILTDVTMPRMDGFALLAALRAEPRTVHIPVVMLSARAGEDGMVEGLEAGADDYLIKPFTARELMARVSANLELDRVRRVRDQLERLQLIQDQAEQLATVGAWEVDLATGTLRGSENYQRMVGHDAAELARLDYREVINQVVDAPFREAVNDAIAVAMERGEPFAYEFPMPDAQTRWVVAGAHLPDEGQGGVLRGYVQDVTQRYAAQQALAAAAVARESAEREHAIADALQRSLLPNSELSNNRLEVASFYRAGVEGTRAGGDWYDVIDLGGTRSAIMIGDVSGRGIRAASLMGQLRAAIHAHARLDLRPADVLEQLDSLVLELDPGSLVTCIYAIHDIADDTLIYASAGHLPAITAGPERDGARALPGPTGPPLGTGAGAYGEQVGRLAPDATLVLYTDGLVERRREPIDDNIAAAVQIVSEHRGRLSDLPTALIEGLQAADIHDDIAILAVRVRDLVHPRQAEHAVAAFPTEVRKARRFTALTLEEWDLPNRIIQDAVTIVSELATNAVIYGRPPLALRLRASDDELLIEMEDALSALPRKAAVNTSLAHGRGLRIVAQLATRWNSRPNGSGKTVWCSIALPASAGSATDASS